MVQPSKTSASLFTGKVRQALASNWIARETRWPTWITMPTHIALGPSRRDNIPTLMLVYSIHTLDPLAYRHGIGWGHFLLQCQLTQKQAEETATLHSRLTLIVHAPRWISMQQKAWHGLVDWIRILVLHIRTHCLLFQSAQTKVYNYSGTIITGYAKELTNRPTIWLWVPAKSSILIVLYMSKHSIHNVEASINQIQIHLIRIKKKKKHGSTLKFT